MNRTPFLLLRLIPAIFCAVVLSASAQDMAAPNVSPLPKTTPWNLEALNKAPEFEWSEGTQVRSLFFSGEAYQGKPTRVFAYYATPGTLAGDPSKDKQLPGIVLVHGGGGKAFEGWAKLWASRGYAAIAMELSGKKGKSDGLSFRPQLSCRWRVCIRAAFFLWRMNPDPRLYENHLHDRIAACLCHHCLDS